MLVILYNVLFFILTDLVEARHNALSFLLLQHKLYQYQYVDTKPNQIKIHL